MLLLVAVNEGADHKSNHKLSLLSMPHCLD